MVLLERFLARKIPRRVRNRFFPAKCLKNRMGNVPGPVPSE